MCYITTSGNMEYAHAQHLCENCKQAFVSTMKLEQHVKVVHLEPAPEVTKKEGPLPKIDPTVAKETAENIVKALSASVKAHPQHINYLQVSSASAPGMVYIPKIRRLVCSLLEERFPNSEAWWMEEKNIVVLKLARKVEQPARANAHIKVKLGKH